MPYDSDEASLVRVSRREYERALKVPPSFLGEFYAHSAASYHAWTKARSANDFKAVRPYLEKTVDLSRQLADFFPGYEHIADPLIDSSDYGMTVATVRPLFASLRERLVPLVEQITAQEPADASFLYRHYPEEAQRAFGEMVIRRYGYDFERGRQDKTHHPFMTKFARRRAHHNALQRKRRCRRPVQHAARSRPRDMNRASNPRSKRRRWASAPAPASTKASRALGEPVGRSRPFWECFTRSFRRNSEQLGDVSSTASTAPSTTQRSLIRVDADEVTYNLHVMIRFELEAHCWGRASVADLPDAWHARYEADPACARPTTATASCRMSTRFAGTVGGAFRATRWATSWARSSTAGRCRPIQRLKMK